MQRKIYKLGSFGKLGVIQSHQQHSYSIEACIRFLIRL